jgi:uncharacterized membrane protein YfbV (UPF0208 family)
VIVTKLAIGAGVVLAGILCWLAVTGVAVAAEVLVTAVALVLLVGGGNWLGGRSSQPPSAGPPSSTFSGSPEPDSVDGGTGAPGTPGP